jgi:hypothetical protein
MYSISRVVTSCLYDYTIRKELATGASEKTKVKNIYDMGGNM